MLETKVRGADEIKRSIMEQFAWDSRVDGTGIRVEVDGGGRVRLTGEVPSLAERRAAEADAYAVPGVETVDNRLSVGRPAGETAPDDRALEAAIRNRIRSGFSYDARDIVVRAIDGHVTLEGAVKSFWQKVKAEALAAETRGVTEITNKLTVAAGDVLDRHIAAHIAAELGQNMSIDMNLINIEVEDGTVNLGGSVPDTIAYRAAQEIAERTRGVRSVTNNLVIERSRQD